MKILFIDRDGTLILEPLKTHQVNSLEEMVFLPNVISSLKKLNDNDYKLVIISNQDGLGTEANSIENFDNINKKMLEVFLGEGVEFIEFFICPHYQKDNCDCRKPKTKMVQEFLEKNNIDKKNSFVIGDRKTDLEFAKNIDIEGFLINKKQNWQEITKKILKRSNRQAEIIRKTKETEIRVFLNLDGEGQYKIDTGLKFFDHMLEQLAKHSNFDLEIKCQGDLYIDEHHTIEDVAIALGDAFKKAMGDKIGIERYAWQRILVMDEAKTEVSLDLSGRAFLLFEGKFNREFIGDFPTEMLQHFYHSFCLAGLINAHIIITGKNTHHMIESSFKAFARTLKDASRITGDKVSSTKGML